MLVQLSANTVLIMIIIMILIMNSIDGLAFIDWLKYFIRDLSWKFAGCEEPVSIIIYIGSIFDLLIRSTVQCGNTLPRKYLIPNCNMAYSYRGVKSIFTIKKN